MNRFYLFWAFLLSINFATAQTYCTPTAGATSNDYWLSNITITGTTSINYNATSYQAYVDNSVQTVETYATATMPIFLEQSTGTGKYYIYVDWNSDGDFDDADENPLATTTYAASTTYDLVVPSTVVPGTYRIRLENGYITPTSPINACGPSDYGNFVDFSIVVTAPPSCLPPSAITVPGALATTATVNWTASISTPLTSYEVYYSTSNTPPTVATAPNLTGITANTVNLTGLTPATVYYVFVRSRCSASETSTWSAATTFTTACAALMAPFTESFSAGTLPPCWVNQNPTTTSTSANVLWKFDGTTGYGTVTALNGRPYGTFVWVDASSPNTGEHTVELITPVIDLTGLATPYVQFDWFKNHSINTSGTGGSTYDDNKLTVSVNDGTGWVEIFTSTSNASIWRTEGMALAASYVNKSIQLKFTVDKDVAGNGYFYDDLLLDEVQVKEAPTCIVPSLVSTNNLSYTSTDITWTASPTTPSLGYEIYYSTSSTAPTAATVPSITGITGVTSAITGLMPLTTYYVWVRTKCNATEYSDWAGGISFTTVSMCPTVTAPADGVLGTSTTPTITWNALAGLTGYRISVGTSPGGTDVLNNVDLGNVTTYTFATALANSTQYYYTVNGYDATASSSGCTERTFSTICATFTAPFYEAFSSGTIPNCWTSLNPTTTSTSANAFWRFAGVPGYGATNNGRVAGTYAWVDASLPYTGEHSLQLLTPQINLAGLTTPYVQFDWFKDHAINGTGGTSTYDDNKLTVEIDDGTGWVEIFSSITNAPNWRTEGITLAPSYLNKTVQLRFTIDKDVLGNGYFYDDVLIDDVRVIDTPTCLQPGGISVNGITGTTVTFVWTAPATAPAGGYDVYYSTSNVAPSGTTTPNQTGVAALTTNFTGLTPLTDYYVWVRSRCSASDQSVWIGGTMFTTGCAAFTPQYSNDFSTFPGSCWGQASGGDSTTGPTGTTGYFFADGFLNNTTTGSAKIQLFTNTRTGWLISPTFDLSAGNYVLKFDYGVTETTGTAKSPMGSDDIVQILMSVDGGTNWSALQTWDVNTGPGATLNLFNMPITSTSNQVKFAFYGTDGAVDDPENYNFYFDNFIIESALATNETSVKENMLQVYPNPFVDIVRISDVKDVVSISIVDLSGRLVKTMKPAREINLGDLKTGMYLINLKMKDGSVQTVKAIKK